MALPPMTITTVRSTLRRVSVVVDAVIVSCLTSEETGGRGAGGMRVCRGERPPVRQPSKEEDGQLCRGRLRR